MPTINRSRATSNSSTFSPPSSSDSYLQWYYRESFFFLWRRTRIYHRTSLHGFLVTFVGHGELSHCLTRTSGDTYHLCALGILVTPPRSLIVFYHFSIDAQAGQSRFFSTMKSPTEWNSRSSTCSLPIVDNGQMFPSRCPVSPLDDFSRLKVIWIPYAPWSFLCAEGENQLWIYSSQRHGCE